MLPALRDVPYVTLAGICGVLALCWSMLSSALPLWVAGHTEAPRAVSGFVVVLSCVGIAALQVRATRAAEEPLSAARAALAAAACLALACALFAGASGPGPLLATALIVAGGVAHVAGELLFVAGSWGLSVPLMRDDLPGQYQGVFATGEAGAQLAGPALMTGVVVTGVRRVGAAGGAVRGGDAAGKGGDAVGVEDARRVSVQERGQSPSCIRARPQCKKGVRPLSLR